MDDTFIVVVALGVVFWGLTMLSLFNVVFKDFGSTHKKALWSFISLIPFVGWLIYFLFGANKGVRKSLKD